MNTKVILLFFISIIYCKTIRHSTSVLEYHSTFIEANMEMTLEQNKNFSEVFDKELENGIDNLKISTYFTKDNIPVLVENGENLSIQFYLKNLEKVNINDLSYEEISKIKTKIGEKYIQKLDDFMKYAKDKFFIDLEIKDKNPEKNWPIIENLIEKNKFYDQISISSFNHAYFEKLYFYNKLKNRKIIFGFLIEYDEENYGKIVDKYINNDLIKGHQLNIYYFYILKNQIYINLIESAHKNGISIAVYFNIENSRNDNKTIVENVSKRLIKNECDVIITSHSEIVNKIINNYYNSLKEGCLYKNCRECKTGYVKIIFT